MEQCDLCDCKVNAHELEDVKMIYALFGVRRICYNCARWCDNLVREEQVAIPKRVQARIRERRLATNPLKKRPWWELWRRWL